MNWYYASNGQRQGPITGAELEKLTLSGMIADQTLVWREGMKEWQPYAAVRPAPALPTTPTAARTQADDFETCAVSGKRLHRREMIQFEGQWVSAEHRDEFFQKLRDQTPQTGGLAYARMGARFLAKLIDGVILFLPFQFVMAQFGLGLFAPDTPMPETMEELVELLGSWLSAMMITSTIGLIYSVAFLSRFQATPGKLVMKLKVVLADGSKLGTGRIIARYFAESVSALILYIGYLIAFFDEPERRALHDRIAGTRVIRSQSN